MMNNRSMANRIDGQAVKVLLAHTCHLLPASRRNSQAFGYDHSINPVCHVLGFNVVDTLAHANITCGYHELAHVSGPLTIELSTIRTVGTGQIVDLAIFRFLKN